MISSKLRNSIIVVVTCVWAVNFLAGIAIPQYEPDQAINAIFMGIVGGLFAINARQRPEDSEKPKPKEDTKEDTDK